MRLIDLLRSRKQGGALSAHESTDAGFLREKDVGKIFNAGSTDAPLEKADIREMDTINAAGSHSDEMNPSMIGDNGILNTEQIHSEWADDPDEAHVSSHECSDADEIHAANLSLLEETYAEGGVGSGISVERLIEPLMCLIDYSMKSNTILRKAVRLKTGKVSFPHHSLNAAIIAIHVGRERNYTDERIFSLALCTLLGDIGMTRIDQSILEKTGKLSDAEYAEIQKHVSQAMQILSPLESRYPFLVPVIAQIHERENASGYPLGLGGDQIHEFAKIIGMCDVYTALTEPKVNREKYSGFVALQQIISRRGEDFDARIIKSLIEAIGIFPLESLVRLNNGLIGRVINISRIHPTRPTLTILFNADGEKISQHRMLDLEKEPLLYIEDPDIAEGIVINA